jgi:hypothetical protein
MNKLYRVVTYEVIGSGESEHTEIVDIVEFESSLDLSGSGKNVNCVKHGGINQYCSVCLAEVAEKVAIGARSNQLDHYLESEA